MPEFIYFFKLPYPFSCSNDAKNMRVAAAAGGCICLESKALNELGGFVPLRAALIDDCFLARCAKAKDFRTWMGLTHSATSLRPMNSLRGIFQMIARSAYTQLNYSALLFSGLTLLLVGLYLVPLASIITGGVL